MADNLEVRGLELKIQATSSNATQSLEKLSSAIRGLQYTKGRAAKLEKMSQELVRFSNTLKGTVPSSISKLTQFANALTVWGNAQESIGKIKFGKSQVNALAYMGDALSGIGNSLKGVDTSAIEKLSAFGPALSALSDIKKPSVPKDLGERLGSVAEVLGKTDTTKLTEQTKQFVTALQPLSELKMRFPNMSAFADNLNKIDMQKLAVQSRLAATAMQPLVATMARLADSFKSIPSNLMIGALVRVSKNSATATPQVNRFNGALKALEKTWRSLGALARGANYVLPFRGLGSTIGGVKKKMDNLFSSLKRIAFYRAIRTFIKNITEGFKIGTQNLYYYSQAVGTKFAPAMDLLATDLLYLRNSIGAAASPLIEKLAPAVDYATDKIVDMINAVNMLMAKLTGKSQWTRALKYPAEYAEATKNSAKAAKDYLLEFDELHVLDDKSGGRGADALDYSRMFQEEELDRNFATWVDDFKNAIKNGDWAGAGGVLGEQLDKVIKSVDGTKLGKEIFTKVNNAIYFSQGFMDQLDTLSYGKGLANFLNTSINTLDTNALGTLMGTRVQKIIEFSYGFVTTFDWSGAGEALTDLLKGWFEAIDGKMIGETISETIKGALTFLSTIASDEQLINDIGEDIAGFLNGLDWYGIIYGTLTTAGTIATAVFDLIWTVITQTDWIKVGSGIYNGLKDGLANVDWSQLWFDLEETLNTIIYNAALGLDDVLGDLSYEAGKHISIALYGGYYDETTGEWVDIKQQALEMAQGVVDGIGTVFSTSGNVIGNALSTAVAMQDILALTEQMPFNINTQSSSNLNALNQYMQGIQDLPSLSQMYGEHTYGVFDLLFDIPHGFKHRIKEFGLDIIETIDDVIASNAFGLDGLDIFGQWFTADKTPWWIKGTEVKTATKTWRNYGNAISSVSTDSKGLTTDTKDLTTAVSDTDSALVTPLANIQNNILKTFNKSNEDAVKKIKGIKTETINAISGANSGLATPLSTLKTTIVNGFNSINTGLNTPVTNIRNRAKNAITGANTDVGSPLAQLKSTIINGFANINTGLNNPITNIRKRMSNAINGAKTDLTKSGNPLDALKATVQNGFNAINTAIDVPINAISGKLVKGLNNETKELTKADGAIAQLQNAVVKGHTDIETELNKENFVGKVTEIWKQLRTNIINVSNNIIGAGEILANGVSSAFNTVGKELNGYKLTLPKEMGGGSFSFNIPLLGSINIPRIPAMAQGGLVNSPTTALIGEAGREAVIPLENNTEWMDQLAGRLAVGMAQSISMTDSNNRPIQVHVTLDGREIYQNQEKIRRSIGYNVGGGAFY